MRSAADQTMVLPFEIERSNSICEQKRYRCTSVTFYFFQIPSHFCARHFQISAIFKTEKTGVFCLRQSILREAQEKKKKNNLVTELRYNLLCKKNPIRFFLSKKNEPKSCPRQRLFTFSKNAWTWPKRVFLVCVFFF